MNQWKSAYAVRLEANAGRGDGRRDVFVGLFVRAPSQSEVSRIAAKPIIFALPIRTRRSRPRKWRKCATTPSWRPGAPTTPTRSTTFSAFLHLPRRARRARLRHQHGDEGRGCPCARRVGARGRSGRGRCPLRPRGRALGRLHHPVPFDPRLIWTIPPAVAKAAMETGVARSRSRTWTPIVIS